MTNDRKDALETGELENRSRRKAVKTIVGGVGALAAYHTLPVNWSKPIVEQIFLPAHAQTSGVIAEEPPAEDAPAEDAPAEDAPAEDAPADDTPAEDAPADDAPADDAPAEEPPDTGGTLEITRFIVTVPLETQTTSDFTARLNIVATDLTDSFTAIIYNQTGGYESRVNTVITFPPGSTTSYVLFSNISNSGVSPGGLAVGDTVQLQIYSNGADSVSFTPASADTTVAAIT